MLRQSQTRTRSAAGTVAFSDRRGLKVEPWIFDQAEEIARRAAECSQLGASTNILGGFDDDRARFDHVFFRCGNVAHAPLGARTE